MLFRKTPPVFVECVGADGTTDKGCAPNAQGCKNGVDVFGQPGHGDGTHAPGGLTVSTKIDECQVIAVGELFCNP